MEKRTVGNRRSEEELLALQIELNKTSFVLEEQEDFKGTPEQLEMMQNYERFYIDGKAKLSDEEWEILKKKFNYKESLTSIAPSGRTWVKLHSVLPSLEKAGNLDEVRDFLNKFPEDQEYSIECKLDGMSGNLVYQYVPEKEKYELDCVTSRGNSVWGLKTWPYALSGVKVNYPKSISGVDVCNMIGYLPDILEMRGEVIIPKNSHTEEKYGKNAVLRSVAAGIFNRKVPFNLKGLIDYIYNELNIGWPLNEFMDGGHTLTLQAEFQGRRCITPEVLEAAKLIASLFEDKDPDKFTKYDKINVYDSGLVEICHENGNTWSGYDDGEELDIVVYSTSINGLNVDVSKLNRIPGFKYIDEVKFDERCVLLEQKNDESDEDFIKRANIFYKEWSKNE